MHSPYSKVSSAAKNIVATSSKPLTNNSMETTSAENDMTLQDPPASAKTYAAQLGMTPPARDYSSASFGAYTMGHYTDF